MFIKRPDQVVVEVSELDATTMIREHGATLAAGEEIEAFKAARAAAPAAAAPPGPSPELREQIQDKVNNITDALSAASSELDALHKLLTSL